MDQATADIGWHGLAWVRTGWRRAAKNGTTMDLLFNWGGLAEIALTLNRVAVGIFFMLSGYHKLFNSQRHGVVVDELKSLGVPAAVELTAGAAILVGFLPSLAALGLLVIILVAMATSGRQRIKLYKPINEADRIDDWIYLPETLYAVMLIMVVLTGSRPYSLDALILGLIDPQVA
jgi:uncharacterized membrane protein YphA (DoxX/SURF4 family)